MLLELLNRLPYHVRTAPDVQLCIDATCGDIVDLRDWDDGQLSLALHGDTVEVLGGGRGFGCRRRCDPLKNGDEVVEYPVPLLEFNAPASASEGLLEALVVVGLDQVIDRSQVEGTEAYSS